MRDERSVGLLDRNIIITSKSHQKYCYAVEEIKRLLRNM